MERKFSRFIGIDYSGAAGPDEGLDRLRVFAADGAGEGIEISNPFAQNGRWSRNHLTNWLGDQLRRDKRLLIGIDHAFSLPQLRLQAHALNQWQPAVLEFFFGTVLTHQRTVAEARNDPLCQGLLAEAAELYRLTEMRTSGARSVLNFRPHGVAFSTVAGIAQLARLRHELGDAQRAQFWPFDPSRPGGSLVLEVYPALFNRQFPRVDGETGDQRDARCAALWLREISHDGRLDAYLQPPLMTEEQRNLALLEGWILGVM